MALLEVKDLVTYFPHEKGRVQVVDHVSFTVNERECFGIIGESGCGKSMTATSIMRYTDEVGARIAGGEILFEGRDVLSFNKKQLRDYRGGEVSMIMQNPMSALDPLFTVGDQLIETIRRHTGVNKKEAYRKAEEIFTFLGIPTDRMKAYPFELSGGMLQRIAGGIAIGADPKLIIADEPTTALDATVQLQYMQLLKKIQKQTKAAILLISHDIRVIQMMCSRIAVMYAGQIVEEGKTGDIMNKPIHPYTKALLSAANPHAVKVDRISTINGQPPFLLNPSDSCRFAERCEHCTKKCLEKSTQMYVGSSIEHLHRCSLMAEENGENEECTADRAEKRRNEAFGTEERKAAV